MFDNMGWWEIACLLLIALFIFGPDRLPTVIRDGVRTLRKVRGMARNATQDFREQLGPDVELEDLHPKRLIRRHLLSEAEEEELRAPFRGALGDDDDDDYGKILRRMRADAGLPPSEPDGRSRSLNPRHPMFGQEPSQENGASHSRGRAADAAPKFDPDAT